MAEVTIFTKSECGYCSQIKGEKTDDNGNVVRDPNGAVQLLMRDPKLAKLGIKVYEYKVDKKGDPSKGVHSADELNKTYNSKRKAENQIRGFPRIEISAVGDKVNGLSFPMERYVSWTGKKAADSISAWIIEVYNNGSFKKAHVSMSGPRLPASETDFRAEARRIRVQKGIVPEPIENPHVSPQPRVAARAPVKVESKPVVAAAPSRPKTIFLDANHE